MKWLWLIPPLAVAAALAGCPDTGIICNPPDTLCGPACANLTSDPANCGGCGQSCATGFVCQNSACVCDPAVGLTPCGQKCVDIRTNPSDCNGCGMTCAADELCGPTDAGISACLTSCPGGTAVCGGGCVDPLSDRLNCGGCGIQCVQGTACSDGGCEPGLEVACYNSAQLYAVDAQAEVVGAVPATMPLTSPVAVAGYGSSVGVVADLMAERLFSFGTTTNGLFQLEASDGIGQGPNSVVVQGSRAYVVNSSDHTLDVIDLSRPPVTDGGSRRVCPGGTSCSASALIGTVAGSSYPQYVAVTPDGTTAYVTLQGNTELSLPDAGAADFDPNGNQLQTIDLTTLAPGPTVGIPYQVDAGYEPRPQGLAYVSGQLFVVLANLTGYEPLTPSTVDVFATTDGGLSLIRQNIPLGTNCLNAGATLVVGSTLFVACGPQYNPDYTAVTVPGAIAGIDIDTLQPAFSTQSFACFTDGGACHAGGTTRMAYAAGKIFVGDDIDGRLFTVDPGTGAILRGPNNAILVCPVVDAGANTRANFISDLAVP